MSIVLAPYLGWRPRSMRAGRSKHESDRGTKRSRLGNRIDRFIYKSAKGYLHQRYAALCRRVDNLNKGGAS